MYIYYSVYIYIYIYIRVYLWQCMYEKKKYICMIYVCA